jgi:hypothetical protein
VLLRILLIVVLIVVVLRALARLVVWATRRAIDRRVAESRAPGAAAPREPRQLVQCPVCDTYFEAGRGLPARGMGRSGPNAGSAVAPAGAATEVCSEACRTRRQGK